MAKSVDPTNGFSLKDLMSDEGLIFDFGEEFEDDDNDRYKYNPKISVTDDELVKYMNLELSDDENEKEEDAGPVPLGLNFDLIKSKMIDLRPDGKIKKLLRQKGVGEVIPGDCMVTIKYSGYFEGQDEPYDSTFQRGMPGVYRLNRGELIFGLDLAIQSMQKHEISIFLIQPDFAYGELGFLPLIPQNAEVMFMVYLIDFIDNGAIETFDALEPEERAEFGKVEKFAKHLMATAADNFSKKQFKKAIRDYKRTIDRLQSAKLDNDDEEDRYNKLLSRAFQNLAVCYNKEDMPRKACIACNQVVYKTAKTHFHYGRALIKMGEYLQAIEKLEQALKVDPQNSEVIKELQLASELYSKGIDQEKRMWSSCLNLKYEKKNEEEEGYKKFANEFCQKFQNNKHIMRQPIPDGLSKEFRDIIRNQAFAMGITVTTHNRYNKEIVYLEKPNYV